MKVFSHKPILENLVIFALRAWFFCNVVKYPWVSSVEITLKLKVCSRELIQVVQFTSSSGSWTCICVSQWSHVVSSIPVLKSRPFLLKLAILRKERPSDRFIFCLTSGFMCFGSSGKRKQFCSAFKCTNKILGHNDACQSMKGFNPAMIVSSQLFSLLLDFFSLRLMCFCRKIRGMLSQILGAAAANILQLPWGVSVCSAEWRFESEWRCIVLQFWTAMSRGLCCMSRHPNSTVLYFSHWQQRKFFHFQ